MVFIADPSVQGREQLNPTPRGFGSANALIAPSRSLHKLIAQRPFGAGIITCIRVGGGLQQKRSVRASWSENARQRQ